MSLNWKSLVSKLHPPLPLSPRESARLLALLNTSFKHQLDRQHPAGLPDSEHHADSHLHTILTNPLLGIRSNLQSMRIKEKPFGRVQDLVKRPMDVFRQQISAGTATIQSASLCLQAQYNSCLSSPDFTLANAMRASGAGTTVLDWLWSSGVEDPRRFLDSSESIRLLVPFLVAERRHDRILQWVRRLYDQTSKRQSSENDLRFRNLLLNFIKAEMSLGQGLDSATAFFIQVVRSANENRPGSSGPNRAFNHVAYYLTIKLLDVPKTADLQATILEPLIDISKSFSLTKRGSCIAALHDVHLARHPSPKAALQYFQGLSRNRIADLKSTQRSRIILLGLKTAELCLHQGRQAEAVQVMDVLQNNFRDEIELNELSDHTKLTKKGSEEAEDQSLRLLDSLAIA